MAKAAYSKRRKLLTRGMSKAVKKKIVKTVIRYVALYSTKTWSLRKEDLRRIERWKCGYGERWNALVGPTR